MDQQQVVLDAYKGAVQRSRWLVLATVLLSSLIALNSYLEVFSRQQEDLELALVKRVQKRKIDFMSCFDDYIASSGWKESEAIAECGLRSGSQTELQECASHRQAFCDGPLRENLDPEKTGSLPAARSEALLQEYGVTKYAFTRTTNTLATLSLDGRTLPFVGVTVSGLGAAPGAPNPGQ